MMRFLFMAMVVFSCFGATSALAKFRLCNDTSYILDATFVQYKGKKWESRGWFRIYPGSCETVISRRLRQKTYYVHARSAFEYGGKVQLFGGSHTFCVNPKLGKFRTKSRVLCRELGFQKAPFALIQAKKSRWTHRFQETRPFPSPQHAMVAGVQRLLRNNGYEINNIDGFWGKRTQRDIRKFQRSIQQRATGTINQKLFNQLLRKAGGLLGIHSGFKLCNETSYLVWAAIGYRTLDKENVPNPQFETKGWVRVEPKSCNMMIREKLSQLRYYIYAEAVDKKGEVVYKGSGDPLAWSGDFVMCLKRLQFKIKNRTQCQERGFQPAQFRRIETRGRFGWTEYLYEGEKAL